MLTSLDGKIIGDYLKEKRAVYFTDEYEKIHRRYGCKAWMCGRVTLEEHFILGYQLDLKQDNIPTISRTDYVANKDAKGYAIAVDPSGKLGWTKNYITDDYGLGDHIIEVLTEQVSDASSSSAKTRYILYFWWKKTNEFYCRSGKAKKSIFNRRINARRWRGIKWLIFE
jgi:hypothetical protein